MLIINKNLLLHGGHSKNPSKTFYQKNLNKKFGIVDASNLQKYVYAVDENFSGDIDANNV